MAHLLLTPSQGRSETLETLHHHWPRRTITVAKLVRRLSNRYHADAFKGGDPGFTTDTITALNALNALGYTTNTVALATDTVRLTNAGRAAGRHARPRTRRIPA